MHPHFSERAFRRYEDTLELVMQNFPSAVWINPAPLSVMTFACRFRDAIRGFRKYAYSSRIDHEKFSAIHDEIVTAIRDESVVIGKKDFIDLDVKRPAVGSVLRADVVIATEDIAEPDEEVIRALCLLASKQILQSATISGVDERRVREISELYDVEIMPHDGKIIIL